MSKDIPAFPSFTQKAEKDSPWTTLIPMGGMTLRDYFAGQVLSKIGGYLSSRPAEIGWTEEEKKREFEHMAHCCYACADAMLAQREIIPS